MVLLHHKIAPRSWAPNSCGVGVTQCRRKSGKRQLRLYMIAQMRLLSWTIMCFSDLMANKFSIKPSLHLFFSGTLCEGRVFLTLHEEYSSTLSNCVFSLRYLRFLQVVDLGSPATILAITLTSLLGEVISFLWVRL